MNKFLPHTPQPPNYLFQSTKIVEIPREDLNQPIRYMEVSLGVARQVGDSKNPRYEAWKHPIGRNKLRNRDD